MQTRQFHNRLDEGWFCRLVSASFAMHVHSESLNLQKSTTSQVSRCIFNFLYHENTQEVQRNGETSVRKLLYNIWNFIHKKGANNLLQTQYQIQSQTKHIFSRIS
jgi:hypothetical protein